MTAFLRDFYKSLQDTPLEPGDAKYVPYLEHNASDADPIGCIATRIDLTDAASVNLVSGQRGSGKSTELRRLKHLLEKQGCVVFLCDMQDYMNLTTAVEITDFFITVMGALGEATRIEFGEDIAREGYWERLVNFLNSEVELKEIKAGVEAARIDIVASLKEDPSYKSRLQAGLRGHVARLVRQSHEFASQVVDHVRRKTGDPDKKVVLIVDSLEQIRGVGTEASEVHQSVENLFSGHASSLSIPKLHVVYTIPPYLTPLSPNLGRNFGGNSICNLPSVHIRHRDGKEDRQGLDVMKEIVEKRFPEWEKIFTSPQIDRLALSSGGDIRDFFRLIRDCLVRSISEKSILPVPESLLDSAENALRREMLPIPKEDAEWLARISKSKTAELGKVEELPQLARFFDTHVVLNYRNGEDWYDVHPLLAKILRQ
ncbi:MAG: ATP-binding protein [Burkholderiales bacterium]|nr:ATP-binding protein [Burkholderiales bacterium]